MDRPKYILIHLVRNISTYLSIYTPNLQSKLSGSHFPFLKSICNILPVPYCYLAIYTKSNVCKNH